MLSPVTVKTAFLRTDSFRLPSPPRQLFCGKNQNARHEVKSQVANVKYRFYEAGRAGFAGSICHRPQPPYQTT